MNFLKKPAAYLLCAVLLFAPMTSCKGPLPAEQGNAMIVEIEKQKVEGKLSPELAAFLIKTIQERMDPNYSGGIDWDQVMLIGGGLVSAVFASLTGVRLTRGAAKPMDKSQADILKKLISDWKGRQPKTKA
ncbi:hypothetical protein LCGC14_1061030 [marine sediment metagenome]|uniref:Uncharacterized protein n=1 Tax=marine sediment metagenome TaxID=412755 RepID=A0A0F9ML66_9ZZZZ